MSGPRVHQGGASAPSNVLTFPQRNRGRVRRSESIRTMGEVMLVQFADQGIPQPSNVERIEPLPEPTPIERSPEMVLILSLFCNLPVRQQREVKRRLRTNAIATKCPHFAAASALLNKEG